MCVKEVENLHYVYSDVLEITFLLYSVSIKTITRPVFLCPNKLIKTPLKSANCELTKTWPMHHSKRNMRQIRRRRLPRQHDHIPNSSPQSPSRPSLQHPHELRWNVELHASRGRLRSRLLPRPVLDHHHRLHHLLTGQYIINLRPIV